MRLISRCSIIALFFGVSVAGNCEPSGSVGVESLSPTTRQLLLQEMQAIQKGMMSIIPALASGNYDTIEKVAESIEKSYILKQALTSAQKHELHHKLPEGFVDLDGKFHGYAAMLKHVAKKKNAELSAFYFYKLTESCFTCHSQFARHRFTDIEGSDHKFKHQH